MSSVTVRVDDATKEAAARIAEDFGFDLSSVTRAFYKQMVREQRIPLSLSYPEPNDLSRASIREADEMIARGDGRFSSAQQLLEDIDS